MTITGSSVIAVREKKKGEVCLRLLEGYEYFKFMGWSEEDWEPFKPNNEITPDMLSDLAGNAFSAYAAGPMVMAAMTSNPPCVAVEEID